MSFPVKFTSPMFVESPRGSSIYRCLRGSNDQNDSDADSLPNCDSAELPIASATVPTTYRAFPTDTGGRSPSARAAGEVVRLTPQAQTVEKRSPMSQVPAAVPPMARPSATDEVAQKTPLRRQTARRS